MKSYIHPEVTYVKLHDMMQVTVISGVADEDSLGRRLPMNENTSDNTVVWDSPFEE